MLVRLDEIEGVARSFSNHGGTLLKIEIEAQAAATMDAIQNELKNAGRKPQLLAASEYEAALKNETWRTAAGVRMLTMIEYGTLAGRWLRQPLVLIPLCAVGFYCIRRRLHAGHEARSRAC